MKVWVVFENFDSDRIVVGVASSREKVDEIIEKYCKYYNYDVGVFDWEEYELDKCVVGEKE